MTPVEAASAGVMFSHNMKAIVLYDIVNENMIFVYDHDLIPFFSPLAGQPKNMAIP